MFSFLEQNLQALQKRQPHLVRLLVETAPDPTYSLTTAADGTVVVVRRQGGKLVALSHPQQAVEKARNFAEQKREVFAGGEPLFFAGLRAGYEIRECLSRLVRRPWESLRAVYVYEEDLNLLRLNLTAADWREWVQSGQVHFFVGPTAAEQLLAFFRGDGAKLTPTQVLVLGGNDMARRALAAAQQATQENNRRTAELQATMNEHYAKLPPAELVRACLDPQRLRVLMIVSRWSYFLRYSTRDIRQALEAMGARVEVLEEREAVDRFTRRTVLEALDQLRPHVLLIIDHLRHEYADLYPAGLPFVAWIQDFMPEIFKPEVGATLGARDLVVGYTQGLEQVGYAPQRLFPLPPLTNPALFGAPAGETRPERRATFSYVSNISSPHPLVYANLRERYKSSGPAIARLLERVYADFQAQFAAGRLFPSWDAYRDYLLATGRELGVTVPAGPQFMFTIYTNLYDSMLRHQVLEWIVADGHDLALWGRGWDKHPTLGKHALGVIENGPDLVEVYRGTTINLHINHSQLEHARILDGLMAGGFFLALRRPTLGLLEMEECLFDSRDELRRRIERFLPDEAARQDVVRRNQNHIRRLATYEVGIRHFLAHLGREIASDQTAETPVAEMADSLSALESILATLLDRHRSEPSAFVQALLQQIAVRGCGVEATDLPRLTASEEYRAQWGSALPPASPAPWPLLDRLAQVAAELAAQRGAIWNAATSLLESAREGEGPEAQAFRRLQRDVVESSEQAEQTRRQALAYGGLWPDFRAQRTPAQLAERFGAKMTVTPASVYREHQKRLEKLGIFRGAYEASLRLVAVDPDNLWSALVLAGTAAAAGKIDQARGIYDRIDRESTDPVLTQIARLLRAYGELTCGRPDRTREILADLSAAARAHPVYRLVHGRLCVVDQDAEGVQREFADRDSLAQEAWRRLAAHFLEPVAAAAAARSVPLPTDGADVYRFDRARLLGDRYLLLRCPAAAAGVLLYNLVEQTWQPLAARLSPVVAWGPYPAFDTIDDRLFLMEIGRQTLHEFDAAFVHRGQRALPRACNWYVEDLAVSRRGAVAMIDSYRGQLWLGDADENWQALPLPAETGPFPYRVVRGNNGFFVAHGRDIIKLDPQGRETRRLESPIWPVDLAPVDGGVCVFSHQPPVLSVRNTGGRETVRVAGANGGAWLNVAAATAGVGNLFVVDDHRQQLDVLTFESGGD